MNREQKTQLRRKSMAGTALLALGIVAAIVSLATWSIWPACAAVILLVSGAVLLQQVGRSLP